MRLLIAQANRPSSSDTFISAHARRLGPDVAVTWGSLGNTLGDPKVPRALRSIAHALSAWARGQRAPRGWEQWTAEEAYLGLISRHRPDVVLAEYGTIGARIMGACRRAGVPFVVHFHGHDASAHDILSRYADDYRAMFAAAHAVIGVSHDMIERLAALGAPAQKLIYNPYGVELERFQGADPGQAPPTFLAVGRFVAKKAPDLTLRAFKKVHSRLPDARLRMVGDGPLLGTCKALADSLGVAHAVTFLGARSHGAVAVEMRAARAFVQHSVEAPSGDREGTPVAVLEASATGLPVVATRHAGIPDVVIEHQTGLLVDERDVEGMATHMLTLAESPPLAATLGAAGRALVAEHFTMDRSIAALRSILEAAAAARMAAPRPLR